MLIAPFALAVSVAPMPRPPLASDVPFAYVAERFAVVAAWTASCAWMPEEMLSAYCLVTACMALLGSAPRVIWWMAVFALPSLRTIVLLLADAVAVV